MAELANDMTFLLNKIERRLGLVMLTPHLLKEFGKEQWAKTIMTDTLVTFSRYYPNKLPMVVNDETCYKRREGNQQIVWYYIKDEVLNGVKLYGVEDIDWMDYTTNNSSLGATSLGGGYYYPSFACPEATFEDVLALQLNANISSLYNRGLYIDFEYPNRFSLKGLGNTDYDLSSFTVILLIQHTSLSTISPTKMETFEDLAQCDVANFLAENLKYIDNMDTAYININLYLDNLRDKASKRDEVINTLKESYVSTSNDNIPYIWTV